MCNGALTYRKFQHSEKCRPLQGPELFANALIWWHISATRYEMAIMIILKNYRDKTKFHGNCIQIAKCFMIKLSRYFVLRSCPQVSDHLCHFVQPKSSELSKWRLSTYRYREAGSDDFYLDVSFVHE